MFSSQNSQISNDANYIEDVFSTYLYTPAVSNTNINVPNGIDLSTKGGMVWFKNRSVSQNHSLVDTVRGGTNLLTPNDTFAAYTASIISSFNTNGFTTGTSSFVSVANQNFASWTFRKQPKFFDVVTYTGNGTNNRAISHALGSVPGCVIVKSTSNSQNWPVYHRSTGANTIFWLNATNANSASTGYFPTAPDSTSFYVGTDTDVNQNGYTYVAYLFAHNAGGFGLTGTDNVISCGSFTTDAFKTGYASLPFSEAQWILVKCADNAGSWFVVDNMRGIYTNYVDANGLSANTSAAETTRNIDYGTGSSNSQFRIFGGDSVANATYIYIAIRRGPMKVPTSGTSVFYPTGWTGSMATRTNTTGFVTDLNISRMWYNFSSASNLGAYWETRLTGATKYLHSDSIDAEASQTDGLTSFASNTGITFGADSTVQAWNYDNNYRNWSFKRAPGFFDEVCYTGTGSTPQNITHNLGVAPELMIIKSRSLASSSWIVYAQPIWGTGIGGFAGFDLLQLNNNGNAGGNNRQINSTAPTASVFSVGYSGITFPNTNNSGDTFVAHLFATCPGVSKVGSYTGNGSSQTINCGFVAGARFVMVKATSTTGNWICADTNSIASDRALYMNNADLEVSGYDWIDVTSSGFIVKETATIAANTNGVTYIFLAIA